MKLTFLILCVCICSGTFSQLNNRYEKRIFHSGTDSMPYRVLLPDGYNPKKKYPLVIMLHGVGERGTENERQLIHGGKLFTSDSLRRLFPCIVLFPQCPADTYWSDLTVDKTGKRSWNANAPPLKGMQLLLELTDYFIRTNKIKKKQIYVGGLSMGGMGTFELVQRRPHLFAASFPVCGGGDTSAAYKMNKTAWWIFHGEDDAVVLPAYSIQMADALKRAGADVKLTLYPGVNHGSWNNAFAEPGLLPWLFSKRK